MVFLFRRSFVEYIYPQETDRAATYHEAPRPVAVAQPPIFAPSSFRILPTRPPWRDQNVTFSPDMMLHWYTVLQCTQSTSWSSNLGRPSYPLTARPSSIPAFSSSIAGCTSTFCVSKHRTKTQFGKEYQSTRFPSLPRSPLYLLSLIASVRLTETGENIPNDRYNDVECQARFRFSSAAVMETSLCNTLEA